jgi:hypothetical protein
MTDSQIQHLLIQIIRVGLMSCIALGIFWLVFYDPE